MFLWQDGGLNPCRLSVPEPPFPAAGAQAADPAFYSPEPPGHPRRPSMKTTRLLSALLLTFLPAAASAAPWRMETLSPAWQVTGFAESLDLSAIAAVNGTRCLVGSDELFSVQNGTIDTAARRISGGGLVPLLTAGKGKKKKEIDIEGIAVSPKDNRYYITGSHGTGKKKGDFQPSRCHVFELGVDPATGEVLPDQIRQASLLPWLEKNAELNAFIRQPLQQNGFNIEGLTFSGGRLYFGVRGPNVSGTGFVIEADPASLFGGGLPDCRLHKLPLGEGRGIREIAAVEGGFLVLTGNASAEASEKFPVSLSRSGDSRFEMLHWQPGKTEAVSRVGTLPSFPGKAEALLVLEDKKEYVDVLVLFDGAQDGGPRSLRLHRPQTD